MQLCPEYWLCTKIERYLNSGSELPISLDGEFEEVSSNPQLLEHAQECIRNNPHTCLLSIMCEKGGSTTLNKLRKKIQP